MSPKLGSFAFFCKTIKIAKLWNKEENEEDKSNFLERLIFERANIVKSAQAKFKELENILDELDLPIRWTIIYCNPKQIDNVMRLLNKRGVVSHRFTMHEGTTPIFKFNSLSERDYLLDQFAKEKYQVLVAMRCLDEGVDIPPARTAILMASSGNPREYIQRIGRVIRRYPGKNEATIHDIVIIPRVGKIYPILKKVEQMILAKEIKRYEEIARYAINNAQSLSIISNIRMQ